jgi:hypothetical protein
VSARVGTVGGWPRQRHPASARPVSRCAPGAVVRSARPASVGAVSTAAAAAGNARTRSAESKNGCVRRGRSLRLRHFRHVDQPFRHVDQPIRLVTKRWLPPEPGRRDRRCPHPRRRTRCGPMTSTCRRSATACGGCVTRRCRTPFRAAAGRFATGGPDRSRACDCSTALHHIAAAAAPRPPTTRRRSAHALASVTGAVRRPAPRQARRRSSQPAVPTPPSPPALPDEHNGESVSRRPARHVNRAGMPPVRRSARLRLEDGRSGAARQPMMSIVTRWCSGAVVTVT